MICSLFGHSKMNYTPYREYIKSIMADLIKNKGVTVFYSGGRGAFDCICRDIICELKKDYPNIISYLILSYHTKPNEYINLEYYDSTLYLLEEKVPLRFAISKTNERIVDESDFVISGVIYTWGGAYKSCEYARRKHKKIINLIEKKVHLR